MMAFRLNGGPMDGQTMTTPGDGMPGGLAALLGGGPPAQDSPMGPMQEGIEEDQSAEKDWAGMAEAEHFNQLMDGVRALAGKIDSEQNKLKLEKVTTMLQEIRAADEAEQESALQGKASPRLMRRAYSGQDSGGAGGY